MSSFEVADVVINPIKDDKGETVVNEHHFTEAVGYFVFAGKNNDFQSKKSTSLASITQEHKGKARMTIN